MIDRSFQVNFISKFVILIILSAVLAGGFLAVYFYLTQDMVITNGKEVYLKYEQKDVVIPKKEALKAGTQTVKLQGMMFTVKNSHLYYVDKKTIYPTMLDGEYRIRKVRRNRKNILSLQVKNRAGRFTLLRARLKKYSVKDGQLGEILLMAGKKSFQAIRTSVSASSAGIDFSKIRLENIKDVDGRFALIIGPLVINTFIFIIITIVFGVFYSHRLAGPVYRINISLDRIIAGDSDFEVRLRKTDAFQHIGEKLNLLLDKIRSGGFSGGKKKPAAKKSAKKAAAKKTVKKAPARKKTAKKTVKKAPARKKTAKKAAKKTTRKR